MFLFINLFLQIKTESGAKVNTNKTGIYKRWKEQSHKKVSLKRTNDGTVEGATTSAGKFRCEPLLCVHVCYIQEMKL